MPSCPRCKEELTKFLNKGSFFWDCLLCSGRAVSMAVIRKLVPHKITKDLWSRATSIPIPSEVQCPFCNRNMTEVLLNLEGGQEEFDICKPCSIVWFDTNEFSKVPKITPQPADPELSLEARKAIAYAKVEEIKNEYESRDIYSGTPDYWWEYILGFLGLPVEYNSGAITNRPTVTWSLAVAMILIAAVTFPHLDSVVKNWALIPNEITRHFGLTFISSFILHGGVLHLLGNLYFLLVFGDNTEDVLGPYRFIMLIFFSLLFGDFIHIAIDPKSSTPVIGASGAISGILAFYCLSFPKARIGFLWWFNWFRIPVGWMFVLWIAGQIFGALNQVSGFGNVSYLAHLGGAAIGVIFWRVYSGLLAPEK